MDLSPEEVAAYLKDCGVRRREREQILCEIRADDAAGWLCLLLRQRAKLLDALHRAQRRIDQMDLLIRSLQQEKQQKRQERWTVKNVLIISTSLRPDSNSERLAKEFAQGAREAGHSVELISLRGKTLRFCVGCLACQKTQRCVLSDDAGAIVEKMREAEVLCFATPVYYYEMAGQMKTLLDRANPLFAGEYAFRDVYLLTASAEEDDSAADGPIQGLKGWIACFEKARLAGVVRGGGVDRPGEMEQKPEKLAQARSLGRHV